jgi:LysM repeat protein
VKAIGIALALMIATAHAEDLTNDTLNYRVKAGDTFEILAAEYYGDHNHSVFILEANNLQHVRPLKPGERIKIPTSRDITTAKGDTFQSIATQYLGDPRRGTFLADFNNMSLDDSLLPEGTPLVIPFHVQHTAAGLETLSSIALAYFGDNKNTDLIRRYNFLDKDSIDKGEKIAIPIYNVKVKPSKLPPIDPDAVKRRTAKLRAGERAMTMLPEAKASWRAGEFTLVHDDLSTIPLGFLDVAVAVEVGVLCGAADVALGLNTDAKNEFDEVLARKPNHLLSAYSFSPKIVAVWKEAGGKVEGAP